MRGEWRSTRRPMNTPSTCNKCHSDLRRILRQTPANSLSRRSARSASGPGASIRRVWIADPWDADYLGVETQSLQQEAEILEAEGSLVLSDDRVLASSGQKLLLEARSYVRTSQAQPRLQQVVNGERVHDVFLSHASEDKPFVRELASELDKRNVTYWLDESEIRLGDSLRQVIDRGLRTSRFGVVILSKHFFAKEWPKRELDGLLASEIDRKVVLPVWHGVTEEDVRTYSLTLAGRYAARSSHGPSAVADAILEAINTETS